MCYYHDLKADAGNQAVAAVYNHKLNLGIAVEFDKSALDHFVEWKMMGSGDFVLGLEPCNSTIDGIRDAMKRGKMKYLKPGESVEYHLKFRILSTEEELEKEKAKIDA